MNFIVDTHVHIYPFYDLETVLQTINSRLAVADPVATRVACLTERYDCDIFRQLTEDAGAGVGGFDFKPSQSGNSVEIVPRSGEGSFFLLPGQQIITAENIEILSLNCRTRVDEGRAATETINDVISVGGIPVVAWAVGKWFFARGRVVSRLLEQFSPDQLAIGDTSLRPLGWMTPLLMRKARSKGFRIIAGSDPLPVKGEETRPGSYVSRIKLEGNTLHPEDAIRYILTSETLIEPAGKRGSVFEVARRLYNHSRAHKMARV